MARVRYILKTTYQSPNGQPSTYTSFFLTKKAAIRDYRKFLIFALKYCYPDAAKKAATIIGIDYRTLSDLSSFKDIDQYNEFFRELRDVCRGTDYKFDNNGFDMTDKEGERYIAVIKKTTGEDPENKYGRDHNKNKADTG